MAKARALVIDDEPANQDFLIRLIEHAGLEVLGAASGQAALQVAAEHDDLLLAVVDLQLPDMPGVELLAQLRVLLPDCILLVATVWDDPPRIASAFENGCDVFLVKPHGCMEWFARLQALPAGRDRLSGLVIDQYGPRPYTG